MLFPRRGSKAESDPYTPLPVATARARRASLAQEGPPTMAFLKPHQGHGHDTRARSASMPGPRPIITVATPNNTISALSVTNSSVSPSRLPRYQQTPRRFHQQSISLQIPKSSVHRVLPIPNSSTMVTLSNANNVTTHSVRKGMSAPLTRRFRKDDPLGVIQHLRNILVPRCLELGEYLLTDDLVALHDREIMERAHRLKQIQSRRGQQGRGEPTLDDTLNVFGVTLRQASLYASTTAIFGGYGHDLPIIVFSCVEELHRKGLSVIHRVPNLIEPSHRLRQLVQIFDSPNSNFGLSTSLADEHLNDIYDLLVTYLTRLPEPVFAPSEIVHGLESAVFEWCIMPEPDSQSPSPSPDQIKILQLLLRLLPSPHLSLFIYLMAFVCQITARGNLNEMEIIGTTFGKWMFNGGFSGSGGQNKAVAMMIWFTRNWGTIINGFFDDLSPLSASAWKSNIRVDTQPKPKKTLNGDASSPSAIFTLLNTLPDTGREGENEVTPSGSAIKLGLVREKSYQYLTANSPGSSCAASLINHEILSSTASNLKQSNQVLHQPDEDDDMSRCSSGSALNERLLEHDGGAHLPSLELPDISPPSTPVVFPTPRRLRLFPPESVIPKSELDQTSRFRTPSSCYSYSSREAYSPELKLDETYKRPLTVINRGPSNDSLLSTEGDGGDDERVICKPERYGNGNRYVFSGYATSSSSDSTSDCEVDGMPYDGLSPGRAASQFKEPVNPKHRRARDHIFDTERDIFCQCDVDCKAHAMVKDLQERLALVTRERDDAVRRVNLMA
ncbi:hypothetical protein E1B28_010469 [Marasmius oreades]|uniref:Rho-GAP domain-containing protein n=1 Tax=Marasmius oreades TaxID=181124 RepID=A0A9P7RXU0_9AGAR|nr:uncharacterized protein E1B28_010469 [Marasmius oreades]KAG7091433.1 hypothetical protein E1B28_010469 [Marasmius oreades]